MALRPRTGCLFLCDYLPTRQRSLGFPRRKWNDIFPWNLTNQHEWLLPLFIPFPNSLIRQRTGLSKFGRRNIPTEVSGPPPEAMRNIPVGRNRNGPFQLNSESLAEWKAPLDFTCWPGLIRNYPFIFLNSVRSPRKLTELTSRIIIRTDHIQLRTLLRG